MSKIVLNEREVAEAAIATNKLGAKPGETLTRVAKYYAQVEGYKKKEIRRKLEDLLLKNDPRTLLMNWDGALDGIVKTSNKTPLIELDGIPITSNELQTIDSLPSKQLARLAFTLLCVAKYWYAVNEKNNMWVNTSDRDIMAMANISASIKRQSELLHNLRELRLIQFSKRVDNLNVQVLFAEPHGSTTMMVTDFRNLGNQYMLRLGGSFIRCEQCGLVVRRKNNAHRYCTDCAAELHSRKSIESVSRKRDNQAVSFQPV